jgi:Glycine cleavage system T protein (aminomethyltransferase)
LASYTTALFNGANSNNYLLIIKALFQINFLFTILLFFMTSLIPTPLKEVHVELGAEMGEFAGWEVASIYSNSIEESLAVRNDLGLFDVSHMGRIIVEGKNSQNFLDLIITKM